MMAKRGTFSHIQRTFSQLSEMVELFGTLYLSEGLEKVVAQFFFRSQYTCGEARRKIWDKKLMLNFSRQAYNEKVTDCHALFRILRFFELGCFLGRNIDLGGSFPTHDLKFGQFCDSTKNFGRPKFCWNFSEIFRFFFEQF